MSSIFLCDCRGCAGRRRHFWPRWGQTLIGSRRGALPQPQWQSRRECRRRVARASQPSAGGASKSAVGLENELLEPEDGGKEAIPSTNRRRRQLQLCLSPINIVEQHIYRFRRIPLGASFEHTDHLTTRVEQESGGHCPYSQYIG